MKKEYAVVRDLREHAKHLPDPYTVMHWEKYSHMDVADVEKMTECEIVTFHANWGPASKERDSLNELVEVFES